MPEHHAKTGRPLRVLQVHDSYAPGWGGEDTVVELERRLLERRGHTVEQFRASHAALRQAPVIEQALAVPGFLWSRRSQLALEGKMREFEPHIVHVHNTFPQFSPSVFWAAHRAGGTVVHTIHNFRHVCANSMLLRDGQPCQECVGNTAWPALYHGCYDHSRSRTAAVVAVNLLHAWLGTYRRAVDGIIVLNDFSRDIFRRANYPDSKMFTKANFVPLAETPSQARERQAVFVGSISASKGVSLLLEAWSRARVGEARLLLIGDGPLRESLTERYRNLSTIEWCGTLDRAAVLRRLAASRVLVFPSIAYENCPMAILEALSARTPVIAADHPSLQAILCDGCEGLLFSAGSVDALAATLSDAFTCSEETWLGWSRAAGETHAERFSEAVNYSQLMAIYETVIARRAASPHGSAPQTSE